MDWIPRNLLYQKIFSLFPKNHIDFYLSHIRGVHRKAKSRKHIFFYGRKERFRVLAERFSVERKGYWPAWTRGLRQLWIYGNTLIFHSPKPTERIRKVDYTSLSPTFNNCHMASTMIILARFMPLSKQLGGCLSFLLFMSGCSEKLSRLSASGLNTLCAA